MKTRAFFYDYKYYLFPDDCTLDEVKRRRKFTARRLNEVGNGAPDFDFGRITEEEIEIEDPDRVFETSVSLHASDEYAERAGCAADPAGVRPEGDGKGDKPSFADHCMNFWGFVGKHLDELADCIDRGDQRMLSIVLNQELQLFFFGIPFYGVMHEGKYTICFHPDVDFSAVVYLLIEYMTKVANSAALPLSAAGWQVLSCIPDGKYSAEIADYAADGSVVIRPERTGERFSLLLYDPAGSGLAPEKQRKLIGQIADRLILEFGECSAVNLIEGVGFTEEKEGMISVKEALGIFRDHLDAEKAEEKSHESLVFLYRYGAYGRSEPLLYLRDMITEEMTSVPEVVHLTPAGIEAGEDWWTQFVSFAYLYIPRPSDGQGEPLATLLWYFDSFDRAPQLADRTNVPSTMGAGLALCGEDGFITDLVVTDERMFFRKLRVIAPVLQSYRAQLVVVGFDGVDAYECGYDFTPVEM